MEDLLQIERVCGNLADYEAMLVGFLGFYEPLEERLAALVGWEESGYDWVVRRKSGWLRSDLAALGRSEAEIRALERCAVLPEPLALPGAFGCAYVLEGATLGGRQILAVLAKSAIPPEAAQFFRSYGDEVGAKWRDFCIMLDRLPRDRKTADAILRAATGTFEALGAWMGAGE